MNRAEIYERTVQIRRLLDDLLVLEAIFSTRQSVVLRGTPRVPFPDCASTAQARLQAAGYSASVERTRPPGEGCPEGILITVPLAVHGRITQRLWVNVVLFLLTAWTTSAVQGPQFAAWLLAILLCHEFGHFILARRHQLDPTWPYFIPGAIPFVGALSFIGTFGAFIRLRGPIRNRESLFDMAAAGPLAGFVVSVVALFVGLSQSTIVGPQTSSTAVTLGDSLLSRGIAALVLPPIGPEQDVMFHPVAFAGWAGLLVTMLNLMPIGQLDGGHIAYALMGRRQRWIALATMAALAAISFWYPGWLMWVAIGLIMRPQHPPTLMDELPVSRTRKVLGWISLAIFVLCFTPAPIKF